MKTCTVCKRELPLDKFWRSKVTKDGRETQCIECRKLKKRGLSPTKWCVWHAREEAVSEFDQFPDGALKDKCREALNEIGERYLTRKQTIDQKNKLIADLQDRLTETEQTLRYKEQQVKQLQGRIAELEFRMETANLFQVIKPHPHLQNLVKKAHT